MKIVPIIPSLDPDFKLEKLVDELIKNDFKKIIIVDDGSNDKTIFKKLEKKKEVVLLTHDVNYGKGKALKTAFTYYQENLSDDYLGVVCLDSDGQHKVSDTIKIGETLIKEDKFILGTRLFNTKETPLRNKTGNRITSTVFKMFYKVYLKDTQTGLRAIPNRLIPLHLNSKGERFEYEINALIDLVLAKEEIIEVDIETVYLENSNKHSHFNPFKDSYRIYKVILNRRREGNE